MKLEPMNPAPPVTSIFIEYFLADAVIHAIGG